MAGIDSVAGIAGPLYRVVREARDHGAQIGSDIIDFVQQGVFSLRRALDALKDGGSPTKTLRRSMRASRVAISTVAWRIGIDTREAASELLRLDGAPVLVGAQEFLSGLAQRGDGPRCAVRYGRGAARTA